MQSIRSLFFLVFTLLLSSIPTTNFAKGPELKFTSLVTSVTQTDPESGTVEISIQALDLPVIVNNDTEIEYQSEQIDLAEISAGDLVKIRAFFSDEGITAEEIEILETRFQQFRLSGVITALEPLGEVTFLTVTGIEVRADNSTVVVPRKDGDALSVSALQVGDRISVNGRIEEGILQARHIFAGDRLHGEIEFDGTVLASDGGSVTVEVLEGTVVTVMLADISRVRGTLVRGAFVEIEGVFDSSLDLIAYEVTVDSDGDEDADDDNPGHSTGGDDSESLEIGSEITLVAVDSFLSGKAETRFRNRDGRIDQKFEVEVEDSAAGVTYAIVVYFDGLAVDLGTFTTNSFGEAEAEFEIDDDVSNRDLGPLLPADMDVMDIDSVEILLDGVPVLVGNFGNQNSITGIGGQNNFDDESNDDGSSDDSSDNRSDDDDSDDSFSDSGDLEIVSETTLNSIGSSVHGDADIRFRNQEGDIDQKFQVEIEDAPVDTTYSILVFFGAESVDFGTFTTDSLGEAEAEYEIDDVISDRPLAPLLPQGISVLDITTVQILQGGALIAQGSF